MKFSTLLGICFQVILINLVYGEVEICLDFDSKYVSKNEGNVEETTTIFEKIDENIKNVFSEFKSSPDTNHYNNFHLNLAHPAITFEGDFSNGTTIVKDQKIKLWTLKENGLEIFNLTFPSIFINGSYGLKGYVGAHRLFDIYGNGTFNLELIDFSISAVASLKINSSAICVPLLINAHCNEYKGYFVNFMDGDYELEPLLNGAIQSLVPDAIEIIFRETMDKTDPLIQSIIDKILHGFDFKSLASLTTLLAKNENRLDITQMQRSLEI